MNNIETQYTCDTFTVYYNGYISLSINKWIIRPALQLFIMCCAIGMCVASSIVARAGIETVGFYTLAILSGLLAMLTAVLLWHTCRTMYKIRRLVSQASVVYVIDDDQAHALLLEAQILAVRIPMC